MEKWQSNNLESLIELVDKTINLIEEKNLESDFDKEIVMLERLATRLVQLNENENYSRH
tara:strand:- start:4150 stop:4326 length:177 start_codon:yes stop_codon:yes gene_type:complete